MSDSYAKLFSSITSSTIWGESSPTRIVWVTMLAMKRKDGCVYASVPGLARQANVTLEECQAALQCFLSPDPYSRTKEHEGRRIEEIDGGWLVLNATKFDAIRSAEERRAYNREYMREYRKAVNTDVKPVSNVNQSGPNSSISNTNTISNQDQEPKKERARKRAVLIPMPEGFDVEPSPRLRAWAVQKGFSRLEEHLAFFADQSKARAYEYADWDSALMNAIRRDWAGLRRAGQPQTITPPTGKTVQAMHTLEALKHVNGKPDSGSHAAANVPRIGGDASGGRDRGDGQDLDGEARIIRHRPAAESI